MNTKLFAETRKHYGLKRFLVKSSMFVLCLTGFLIHSYFKIRLFYDQEPISEYANERAKDLDSDEGDLIKLPSFSVCFSGSLFRRPVDATTASLLASNQRRSSLYYHSRQRLPPNVALLDDFEQPQFDDDFALRRRQMFASSDRPLTGNLHAPRSVNQMISVDQAFGLVSKPRFSIKCDLIKPTKQRKLTRFTDNPLSCEQIANVIESINYEADQKCFTFFSQLQQTPDVEEDDFLVYRSDLNGGDLVQIRILFEEELLGSKFNQGKVHLLIHSNVEMPNFQQMKTHSLRSSHNYVIYFNQLTYKRENTNQSPCRVYKNEPRKPLLSYLQQMPSVLMNYQARMKSHLFKLLFSGEEANATRVEDQESQQQHEIEAKKKETPKSQSDCVDKCHLETNRKYCICLPAGVNVRRELLSSGDLFCDELRCIQEDLPSAGTTANTPNSSNGPNGPNNLFKNGNLKKDQLSSSASNEQLERLYTISNGQFVSKRYERFKKCLIKNNCIASCEEDRYDDSTNEKPDLNLIVQNILSSLPTNASRYLKSRNMKSFARFNYYPNGYYYPDPSASTSTPPPKVENKRFSFKHKPENRNRPTVTGNNSPNRPNEAFDDLGRTFPRTNGTALNDTTRLSTSIMVQAAKRNQSSFTTSSVINRRTVSDQRQPSFGQTNAISDNNQLKSTTSTAASTESVTSSSSSTSNSIDPDSIDDNLDNEDQAEYTQPTSASSSGKAYTVHSRKAFKFATSTVASANKNADRSVSNASSSDEELLDDIPVDENVEERHNSIKPYQSLISIRNNRNGNRLYRERLSYPLIDLMFDLSLIAVVWLGFSVYLVADYFIYLVFLTFWHFVRLTFCLDWWFKKSHHRIVDSASSIAQLTTASNLSPKGSLSSQASENQTFVKSIP